MRAQFDLLSHQLNHPYVMKSLCALCSLLSAFFTVVALVSAAAAVSGVGCSLVQSVYYAVPAFVFALMGRKIHRGNKLAYATEPS